MDRENDGTGLYYYQSRYYASSFGRFMSEDQIGLLGGTNVYSYVGNNPLNVTEPSGNDGVEIGPWKWGHGDPDYKFTGEGLRKGLSTGLAATAYAFSWGLYDGGAYRCEPGFGVSAGLATVGREALV